MAAPYRGACIAVGPGYSQRFMDSKEQARVRRVEIRYCPKCGWLPRATWIAQELLQTFGEALSEVALIPAAPGTLEVWAGSELVWTRSSGHSVPEIKALKAKLRDTIAPDKDLGHSEPA